MSVDAKNSQASTAPRASYRTALIALLAFGALAAAGGAGFAVGRSTTPAPVIVERPGLNPEPDTESPAPSDAARATLADALAAGNKLLSKLTPMDLEVMLQQYRAAPSEWQDTYLNADIMSALDVIEREQDVSHAQTGRRLGQPQPRIGGYDEDLVNMAWEMVDKENYTGAVRWGSDAAAVRLDGSTCWVIAQESNELIDWIYNLQIGTEPLYALKQTQFSHESCGCAKKTLWWCSRYKSCPGYRKVGTTYQGFAEAANKLRLGVLAAMQSTCAGTTATVLAGYSRGGAIVIDLAVMLLADNIVSPSSLAMVTFGSPRALDKATADALHLRFPQWRIVNDDDMVSSLPYDWWGFSHVGQMRCNNCDYPEGRERPYASFSVADHLDYCKYFGDKRCS